MNEISSLRNKYFHPSFMKTDESRIGISPENDAVNH